MNEQHDIINTIVTALVTSIAAAIYRGLEKRRLRKSGKLKDQPEAPPEVK